MQCEECGGNLERIAIDCYRCISCGKKSKVAFLEPQKEININSELKADVNKVNIIQNPIIKSIKEQIINSLGVSQGYLNNKNS